MGNANTPYSTLPPAQRLKKFQEQIVNCKNELEKKQKARYVSLHSWHNAVAPIDGYVVVSREGLNKMKLVFKENPKFGDEQDVTQQIIAIDENIEKLFAEIKRFEVDDRSLMSISRPSFSFLSPTWRKSNERVYRTRPNTNQHLVCERTTVPISQSVIPTPLLSRAHRHRTAGTHPSPSRMCPSRLRFRAVASISLAVP